MYSFLIKNSVLVRCLGDDAELIIPDVVRTIVTYTSDDSSTPKQASISQTIKEIGPRAFSECEKLQRVVLCKGIRRIRNDAFMGCSSLKQIKIPDSVTKIGELAFCFCPNLETIILEGKTVEIDKNIWGINRNVVVVAPHMPLSDVPSKRKMNFVTWFVKMQNSVQYDADVAQSCLEYVSRQRKRLYDTEDDELFAYILQNKLVRIDVIDELVERFGKVGKVDRVSALLDYKEKNFSEEQKASEFDKQLGLRDLTVSELKRLWQCEKKPDGTYRITSYLGRDTDVIVPSEIGGVPVTEIGRTSEKFCKGCIVKAQSVVLPEGLQIIGKGAFYKNNAISEIILPSTVTEIGESAFRMCCSLKKVTMQNNVTTIGDSAFSNCTALKELILPNSVTKIGTCVFFYCLSLKNITLSNNLTSIGASAFERCSSLTEITLPPMLKAISDRTFSYCCRLRQINIPASVTQIGSSAFYETALVNVDIPEGVKKIGRQAFDDCSYLQYVVLPKSLTNVEFCAFGTKGKFAVYSRDSQENAPWKNSDPYLLNKIVWNYNPDVHPK